MVLREGTNLKKEMNWSIWTAPALVQVPDTLKQVVLIKPTSKWRVMSKKSSRQMTATDLWKLEKCRCTQYASPAQAEQKMDLHGAERHMQAQYPPYLIGFCEKTQQVVRQLNRNNLWKWQIIWKTETDHSSRWQSGPLELRIQGRRIGKSWF